jgi:hypothetical protein
LAAVEKWVKEIRTKVDKIESFSLAVEKTHSKDSVLIDFDIHKVNLG